MKSLNACVIKCLENCHKETMLTVLLDMLNNYTLNARMQHTIINCLMKMMDGIGDTISTINIEQIFMKMHLYLILINQKAMTVHDENGIRVMKTLVNKIVLERKESVIDSYQAIREHEARDRCLKKWIRAGLKSL